MNLPSRSPSLNAVVTALEDDIIFGRLKPRERLTEDALMARFDVKRHVVRQALAELENLGVVVREPYRGAMVRDFSIDEVEEVFQLRTHLQAWAAELIPLPVSDDTIARLEGIFDRHQAAAEAGNLRQVYLLDNDFHAEVFKTCGNRFLGDIIMHLMWLTTAIRSYPKADPALLALSVQEHREIIETMKGTDQHRLAELFSGHLTQSKKSYLDTVRFIGDRPASSSQTSNSMVAGLRAILGGKR